METFVTFNNTIRLDHAGQEKKIIIAESNEEVTIKPLGDISLEKEGQLDDANNKVSYTLTISTEKGTPGPIDLKDYFERTTGDYGDGTIDLKPEYERVKVRKIDAYGSVVSEIERNIEENDRIQVNGKPDFEIKGLDKLGPGEKYQIEYKVGYAPKVIHWDADLIDREADLWNRARVESTDEWQELEAEAIERLKVNKKISDLDQYSPITGDGSESYTGPGVRKSLLLYKKDNKTPHGDWIDSGANLSYEEVFNGGEFFEYKINFDLKPEESRGEVDYIIVEDTLPLGMTLYNSLSSIRPNSYKVLSEIDGQGRRDFKYYTDFPKDNIEKEYDEENNKIRIKIPTSIFTNINNGKGKHPFANVSTENTFNIQITLKFTDKEKSKWNDIEKTRKEFENTVKVKGHGDDTRESSHVFVVERPKDKGIDKTVLDFHDQGWVDYQIIINRAGADLSSTKDWLTLRDKFSVDKEDVEVSLDIDSVKVHKYSGNYNDPKGEEEIQPRGVRLAPEKKELVMEVPDSQALVLSYKLNINRNNAYTGQVTVNNTARLEDFESVSTSEKLEEVRSVAGMFGKYKLVELIKLDGKNYLNRLPGAELKVEAFMGDQWLPVVTGTTGGDGKIILRLDQAGSGFERNTLYRISESQAPGGYLRTDRSQYFVWLEEGSTKDTLLQTLKLPEDLDKEEIRFMDPVGVDWFYIENNPKIDIEVNKVWEDAGKEEKRPGSIKIILYADGVKKESKDMKADRVGQWKLTFTDLPKYNDQGQEILYTVREDPVPTSYVVSYDGLSIKNTYKEDKVSIPVTKSWQDDNNRQGLRPESITIKLLADGQDTGQELILSQDNSWTGAFTGLDKYKDGKEIQYTIKEEGVSGYSSHLEGDQVNGFKLTNTLTPPGEDPGPRTKTISGYKTWDDNHDQAEKRPASITIRLFADGEEVASREIGARDNWSWTFTGLDKYDSQGREIEYTISEDLVPGYTGRVKGFNVTNIYEPEEDQPEDPNGGDQPPERPEDPNGGDQPPERPEDPNGGDQPSERPEDPNGGDQPPGKSEDPNGDEKPPEKTEDPNGRDQDLDIKSGGGDGDKDKKKDFEISSRGGDRKDPPIEISSKGGDGKGQPPKTGDEFKPLIYLGLMALALIGLVLVRRLRRRHHE